MRRSILALGLALVLSLETVPLTTASAAALKSPTSAYNAVSGEQIVQTALRYVGYPYTTVGNSPSLGFSCIGLVSYVYLTNGIPLPDDLWDAQAYAPAVAFNDLLPGDVLFFQNTVWPGLSHTAIYLGGGRIVHAAWYNRGVITSSLYNDPVDGNYWIDHYLSANRPWGGVATGTAPVPSTAPTPATTTGPSTASVAPALRQGPRAKVRVGSLNVRVRPSLLAPVGGLATHGTNVVVLKQYRSWFWVQLPNTSYGWVFGSGIGEGSAIPAANRVAGGSFNARIGVNGLRVHQRPGLYAAVVATAYHGQRLQVLNRWNGWLRVLLADGTSGWVRGTYVFHGSAPASTSTPASFMRVPGRASGAGWTAKVTTAVRLGPSSSRPAVALLAAGGWYRVVGWSGRWAHIQLASGLSGYIPRGLVGVGSVTSTTPASGNQMVSVSLRLHARPGLAARVVGLAVPGMRVRVLRSTGTWARVSLPDGTSGYVYRSYLGQGPGTVYSSQ